MRIAMPMAEMSRDLRTRSSLTNEEAVKNARLEGKAPTCFVALKINMYVVLNETGNDCSIGKIGSPK